MRLHLSVMAGLVLVCVAWLTGLAFAAPSTPAFDALTADLQTRKAENYMPPLTRVQRAELRAIDQSLARLARPHADLVADAKSAALVAKALRTGFPREFNTATATSDMAGLVAAVFRNLLGAAESEYWRLEAALAAVGDSTDRAAATAKLNAARRFLDTAAAPATTPARAASLVQQAYRAVSQGLAIALPHVDGFLTAKLNGRAVSATEVNAIYSAQFGFVSIVAKLLTPAGQPDRTIHIVVRGAAVGRYELGAFSLFSDYGFYYEGAVEDEVVWYSQLTEPPGAIEFTEFDPANGRVAGTFSFVAMRNGNSTKKVTGAKFVATKITSQSSGS
ncbi:MAG: hypothetical protein K8T90_17870 [Planctomycetes bacterium]|nr:hypothetical protein [Planctomycetota bacterium]